MTTQKKSILNNLLPLSLALVVIGSALHALDNWWWESLIIMAVGTIGMAFFFLMNAKSIDDTRQKRLNRLGFIGSLFYIVSIGFMYSHLTMWILLFSVGTVFVAYSLLMSK